MFITLGDPIVVKTASAFNGRHEHPAIVNRVWDAGKGGAGMVNVTVLPDCGSPFNMTSVHVSEKPPEGKAVNESGYGWLPEREL